jgi:hypothetical protein
LVAQQLRIGEILLEDGSNYLEELLFFFAIGELLALLLELFEVIFQWGIRINCSNTHEFFR